VTPSPAIPRAAFWRGRRVLLTGHTGFKGAWLALWLRRLGAQVHGYALPPSTTPALHALLGAAGTRAVAHETLADLADLGALQAAVDRAQPEVVLHLAAQPLVRASYAEPLKTFETNVMGTARLLQALRGCGAVKSVVVVTTDKVYRNLERPYPYREDDALGGHDPYSASKAASELVAACWRDAFLAERGVALATARAGNVVGGGDWSADRLLPDAVRAWQRGEVLTVRRPQAVRPWQHVLEPLAGYLLLAEALHAGAAASGAWNFGPHTHEAATVGEVVTRAAQVWGGARWHCPGDDAGPHEAGWLALEVAHARATLGVAPRWDLGQTVQRTLHWYRRQAEGADPTMLCHADIDDFEAGAAAHTPPSPATLARQALAHAAGSAAGAATPPPAHFHADAPDAASTAGPDAAAAAR
jgi:CDP-glucose 4,6-dehydratase